MSEHACIRGRDCRLLAASQGQGNKLPNHTNLQDTPLSQRQMVEVAELSLAFAIISLLWKGYLWYTLQPFYFCTLLLTLFRPGAFEDSRPWFWHSDRLTHLQLWHAIRWNQDLSQDLTAMVKEAVAQIRQIWVFRSSSWGVCLQFPLRCQGRKSPST